MTTTRPRSERRRGSPPATAPPQPAVAGACRGLTLIELLIVALILGLLAAVAMPLFGGRSEEAKQAALEQNLAILNKAVELYTLEHGAYPGKLAGETSWEIFSDQLTLPTDAAGASGGRYGPYLRTGIPRNPLNGSIEGTINTKSFAVGGVVGWHFDRRTGVVSAYGDSRLAPGDPVPPEEEPQLEDPEEPKGEGLIPKL